MNIRKYIILGGASIALMATLTGCVANEVEVKKTKKEADITLVNYSNNISGGNNIDNNLDENWVDVQYIAMTSEEGYYIVVFGYDRDATKKWEYTSKMDKTGEQYANVEFLEHDPESGIVLIRELDTIKALDDQTGKEKWKIDGYDGRVTNSSIRAADNVIYVYSFFPQKLYIIGLDGKLKKTIDMAKLIDENDMISVISVGNISIFKENDEEVTITSESVPFSEPNEEEEEKLKIVTKKMTIDINNEKVTLMETNTSYLYEDYAIISDNYDYYQKYANNKENNYNVDYYNEENNSIDVKYIELTSNEGNYVVVFGYGKDSKKLWEYKTKPDTVGAQYSSVGYVLHDIQNGNVILYELGTIKAIDDKTGREKWIFEGFKGFSPQGVADDSGNIYLYSFDSQKLYILDKDGKLKKNLDIGNLVSEDDQLPIPCNGINRLYLDDSKRIIVIYEYTVNETIGDSSISVGVYTEKMTIDAENEDVKIETIDIKKDFN